MILHDPERSDAVPDYVGHIQKLRQWFVHHEEPDCGIAMDALSGHDDREHPNRDLGKCRSGWN